MRLILISLLIFLSSSLQATDRIYKGKYTYGPEAKIFSPCSSEVAYWVSFDWAGLQMQEYYKQHQQVPYQRLYIEFRGHLLNEKVDGFAFEYDGLIRISEVKKQTFELPDDCW